jgi:hypothetical protein
MAFALVPCAWSEAYIWSLTGSDSRLGSYEGFLEIRETESESMDV